MENTHTEPNTYTATIPAARLQGLTNKFNRLKNKAIKHDTGLPPTLEVGEVSFRTVPLTRDGVETGKTVGLEVVEIKVTTPTVKIPGAWHVIGSIKQPEHPEEEGNLVYALGASPQFDATAAAWQIDGTHCDHCQIARRRKRHVIVSDGSEVKIVGHTCLVDFLGHDPMGAVLINEALAGMVSETGYDEYEGIEVDVVWSGPGGFPISEVIDTAARSIDHHGYESASKGNSTKAEVWRSLVHDAKPVEPHPDTEAALEWAATLEGNTSFEHNMRTIASRSHITYKDAGFAAYIYEGYRRAEAAKLAEAAERGTQHQERWESIGTRAEFSGRVTRIQTGWTTYNWVERAFSWVDITLDTGELLTWKASRIIDAFELAPGDEITGRATVKSYERYEGQTQTRVTRVTY